MKQRKNPQEGFYSISQVANLLHVSTHSIRNLEREFSLEVTKDSDGNRIYDLETVEKYRTLIQKKNEAKFSKFELKNTQEKNNESFQYMTEVANASNVSLEDELTSDQINAESDIVSNSSSSSYNKNYLVDNNNYPKNNIDYRNILPAFSSINLVRLFSKFFGVISFAVIAICSLTLIGAFSLNTFLKNYDPNSLLLSYEGNSMSNVLQSTTEDWNYRFDVNVPAYMNSSLNVSGSLAGSNANFQIITVGQVVISQTGISAPNVVNLVSTKAGEKVILVDNTNRNQPIITLAANPQFDNLSIKNLNGVTQLDDTTIQTIQDNIKIPTANADAETLGGLTATDFLRSNANTLYTGGTLEFGATSSVKFSNLSANTFLRLNNQNVLTSFDITAGSNISITSTANSLVISASTGATSNVFSSAAIKDLFLGTTSFDENYRIVVTAGELNQLHTLSGNLVTSTNFSANLFSAFPNIDTNASDDLNNAVLITSLGGKTIYSTNTWYGTQDFSKIKADSVEIKENGYIKLVSGSVPVITNSSLYNSGNRLYFEDLPLVQVSNTSINDNVNKLAYFVTNASGELLIQGTSALALDVFETGANGQIIGVYGNSTKYLTVTGDITVSTTSSSQITFQITDVNTNPGTFGTATNTPIITVNSKGQIISITTAASSSNNFTTSITFSTPGYAKRDLILQRNGLSDLTASFSLGSLDITTALGYTPQINLGYTPLKNTSDTLSGSLVITQTLASASIFQNGNLVCDRSGNCSDVYIDTTNANNYVTAITFSDPAATQKALILSRNGLSNLTALFSISSSDITTALGYTPQINLGYTPLKNSTDTLSGNLVVTQSLASGTIFQNGNLVCDTSGNCSGVYIDTTNANNYVTAITFSDPAATQKALILSRNGLSNLTALFSISSNDVNTALGYTPLKNTSDTLSGSLVITQTLASASIFQNGNLVCDRSGNCSDVYIDTTNANNYVTSITFSTPASAQRTLTLTREGLSNLNATFSMTSSDVVTALGYTPLQATDTVADKFINSFGIQTHYITQNIEYNFSLGRSDGSVILASTYLTPKEVTTALGYTPLRATDTEAEKYINSFGISNTYSSQNVSYFFSIARNDGTTFPVNFSLIPSVITTALGYTPLQASETTPSYFVTSISFSDAAANTKVFTLNRQGTNALSAIFSLSSFDITSALGYTPLNKAGDTISGNLTVNGTLSANKLFQNGNLVCDLSGNCGSGHIYGSGSTGYISLFNASSSIGNSEIFQNSGNIGIGTTNPSEKLDVYGAIKLSQSLSTVARNNALYQSEGVLYWNGQAVGVVGSTAPGGISGTKDYLPYFNTNNTLIATEFRYTSTSTERGLDLSSQNNLEVYLGVGHQNDISARLGVASNDEGTSFFSRFESHDDLILENLSNRETSDMIFVNKNILGSFLYTFGKNDSEAAGVIFKFNTSSNRTLVGIGTTNPNFNLEVVGSAKVSETFAASTFSTPTNNSFIFLSGAYFRGNLSAGIGTFTNLTLANALGVNYGGTGLSQTPANGQLLIGSNGGYALAPITAGTNITISTSAGGITINAVLGGTNANNYVTSIVFSDPAVSQKTLVLAREGLSSLTATFSISASDITSALGYTPLQASSTEAEKYINSFGLSSTPSSQNVSYFFSIARNDGVTFPVSFALTPRVITTALGYTPLQAGDTAADKYIQSIATEFEYISQNVQFNISLGRSDLTVLNAVGVFTPSVITTALGYTPLKASDTEAEKYINSFGLSNTYSAENVSYFFSIARNDGTTFPVNFALTPAVITTALGYTPLQAGSTGADKFINSYGVATSYVSQNVTYNFSIARNDGVTFPASVAVTPAVVTTALGYTPLKNTTDTLTGNLGVSGNFSSANAYVTSLIYGPTTLRILSGNGSVGSPAYSFNAAQTSGIYFNTTNNTLRMTVLSTDSVYFNSAGMGVLGNLSVGSAYINGDLSAGNAVLNSISLANALPVIFGGTGLTAQPANGQLLIGNGTGYSLSALTAGNNISISTGAGSITITSTDTTNANNFVTSISFSDAAANTKVFTLNREGTNALSAIFSLSTADITTALGYTPVNSANTEAEKYINSFGLSNTYSSQNVSYFFSIARNDGTTFPVNFSLIPSVITTALGYTPLQASDTSADKFINSFGISSTPSSQNFAFSFSLGRSDSTNFPVNFNLNPTILTTALGYTPLNKAGDTVAGNLTVTGTLQTSTAIATISLSARHLFIADTSFTNRFLHIDPNIGNFDSKLAINMNVGSSINSELGMLIQSVKFSSPLSLSKNLTFNVLDPELSTRVDIVTTGTIPTITAGSFSLGEASLLGGNATFNNLYVSENFSASKATIYGNFSASTAFVNGYFSAGSSSLAGLSLTGSLFGTSASFTGNLSASTAFINGYFSAGNSTLAGLTVRGDLSASTAYISGNVIFSSISTIGGAYFSSPISANTFNFVGGTLSNGFFSTPQSSNVYTFLSGTIASSNLSIAGNAIFTSRTTMAVGYFSSPLANNTFNFVGGTISASVFSAPNSTNTFTFLGNVNFSGNISAANGTFVTLSAQSLNVNNLFTVDASGSVFNNNVSFNDTVEFNAVGDLAIANDLVFTNTALSKIRTANDLNFEIGEPYNSSNIVFNMFNSGEFIINGDMQLNGVLETMPTGFFSSPLSNNTFNFLGGTLAAATFSSPSANGFVMLGNLSAANASFVSLSIAGMSLQFEGANNFAYNIGTGYSYNWEINGTSEMKLSDSTLSLAGNNLISVGGMSAATTVVSQGQVIANDWVYGINDVWTTGEFGWFDDVGQNTYIGLPQDNQIDLTLNGVQEVLFTATTTTFNNNLSIAGGIRISGTNTIAISGLGAILINGQRVVTQASDRILKSNIQQLTNPFESINKLRAVTFNWVNSEVNGTYPNRSIGMVAQEVDEAYPNSGLVGDNENGTKYLRYDLLSALLIEGIKEQQVQINNLSVAQSTIDFSQASSMYTSLMNTIDALAMSTDNGDLVVGTDLIINGKTILNEATFTGDVQLGQMKFDTLNNDLSVLGASCVRADGTLDDALCQTQALFLMKNKAGNLNIFDGKVVLKPNGDMQVEKINVTEIKADEYKVASTSQVSGSETLLANQTEIVITTNKVKANSKVFVSASNNLEGKTLYVDEKVDGVSFKVKINQSMTTDVKFDWFILNVE